MVTSCLTLSSLIVGLILPIMLHYYVLFPLLLSSTTPCLINCKSRSFCAPIVYIIKQWISILKTAITMNQVTLCVLVLCVTDCVQGIVCVIKSVMCVKG